MHEENQGAKLKQLFAKRVTNQSRIVIDFLRQNQQTQWQDTDLKTNLSAAALKLADFAERFEMSDHQKIAENIHDIIAANEILAANNIQALEKCLVELNSLTLRKSDQLGKHTQAEPRTYLRPPVFIALDNKSFTNQLINQLDFFGFRSVSFEKPEAFLEAIKKTRPETVVMDVNFGGPERNGIGLVQSLQSAHSKPTPVLYINEKHNDVETRLEASRSGGEEYFYPVVDPGKLIERIEHYSNLATNDPYKVLVVDDSIAQAKYAETILKKSGMEPFAITDPMQLIEALNSFHPEIIIMDMYMPGCTGMELARLVRQHGNFDQTPIIYLSAEDDLNKQLHAMSQGGDDFLTKPIDPKHLATTIQNRGRRARALQALMVRDSLTGLYNHSSILKELDEQMVLAKAKKTNLSYVMIDIDEFKAVNNKHGHDAGDKVIKCLALFLKQRLRKSDVLARFGGQQFALILPDTNASDARTIMNEIRERFSALPQPFGKETFTVSFSCGVAHHSPEHDLPNGMQLSAIAENALKLAKNRGKNSTASCQELDD